MPVHPLNKYKNLKRSKENVKKSYNDGVWKSVRDSEFWKKKNLEEFLHTDYRTNVSNSTPLHRIIDGKWVLATYGEYFKIITKKLFAIISTCSDKDEIVELGCGFGRNLFSLRFQNISNPLTGYDISKNSIQTAMKINNQFNTNIDFGVLDITLPFKSKLLSDKTIFTFHCLEQLKHFMDATIQNILNSKPRHVFHFEPISELLGYTPRDIVSRIYNSRADYQNNILSTLKSYEKKGRLKIIDKYRTKIAGNPFNETCLIHWIPKY